METVADWLYDLPRDFGWLFDGVHYLLCLQAERADLGPDFERFSARYPLACWFSSMLTCFAGGILVAAVCGEPILSPMLDDPLRLVLATLIWYLIFYGPRDLVHQVTKHNGLKLPAYIIKGLYYPKKIVGGIKHSRHVFGKNALAAVALATVKANGSGLMRPIARLFRGRWTPEAWESIRPSVTTKYCFICAVLYTLFPTDGTYIFMASALVAMKVGPTLGIPVDLFSKVEAQTCPILFGRSKHD